jgi:hypothetical protein
MKVQSVRRPSRPPLPALTERDEALLAQLAEHEPLSTSELRLIFFTGARACRARLNQLEQHQLVLRVYPAAGRRGTCEALWFLTSEGRTLLGAPQRRVPSLSIPDLEHRRDVAVFFAALIRRGLQHQREGLWCWHGESRAQLGAGGRLRPDGYGRYLLADGELSFYLELDRGTEPAKRVGEKLAAYTTALATDKGRDRGNVLLVCRSQRRLRSLAAHGPNGPPWVWGTLDGERFQLLPALSDGRQLAELPLWPRDRSRPVSGCLGRRWQTWGHEQWHSQQKRNTVRATSNAVAPEHVL